MAGSPQSSSTLTRGYSIALISAAILSTTAIFIRHLTQAYQMPPLVLAFWRDSFVAATMLIALMLLRPAFLQVNRRHLYYLIGYGLVLAIFNTVWTYSVAMNGAAISTILVYSSGAFAALLGRWFLKERLDWAKLLAVSLSMGGCILVSGALPAASWGANLGGILTGILSGLCYAIYSLLGRSASQRGLNPWTTLFYTFGFAACFLLFFNQLESWLSPGALSTSANLLWLGKATSGWAILLLLAAGPTLAGFGLYNVSLVYLPSSVANLIATLEPPFTAILAYILLGERLNGMQVAGSAMILAGVVLLRIYEGWLEGRAPLDSGAGIRAPSMD